MKLGIPILLVIVVFLTIAMLFTPGWDRPPIDSKQLGYDGVGMVDHQNPRRVAADKAKAEIPPEPYPLESTEGPRAGDAYDNVQVLGDLSVDQFNRLMAAITTWMAPQEEGCNYCHVPGEDLAKDTLYTKIVSRRMLQMNIHINTNWTQHVGDTGVTCYTCHRGKPVPDNIWFEDPTNKAMQGLLQAQAGQNRPSDVVGVSSLPIDFAGQIVSPDAQIRVLSDKALPRRKPGASIQQTEHTYGLMIHMSQALGVNCTYCHNSRAVAEWGQSRPQRVSGWHALEMLRDLNTDYLIPLKATYPPERLGPTGDAPKANCATCHYGVNLPLYGAKMSKDYPSLTPASQ
jgi:photosynthetic reaction center cytochrome c subunit